MTHSPKSSVNIGTIKASAIVFNHGLPYCGEQPGVRPKRPVGNPKMLCCISAMPSKVRKWRASSS